MKNNNDYAEKEFSSYMRKNGRTYDLDSYKEPSVHRFFNLYFGEADYDGVCRPWVRASLADAGVFLSRLCFVRGSPRLCFGCKLTALWGGMRGVLLPVSHRLWRVLVVSIAAAMTHSLSVSPPVAGPSHAVRLHEHSLLLP